MLLEWNIMMETEKKQCEAMSEADKFRYFLMLQYRSPYGWGKENPMTADCSGSVCLALMMATGLKVRTTADGLLRKFFTEKVVSKDGITAAFFLARTDRKHGNRIAKKGEAVHVAGLLGEGVAFNCVEPFAEIRTLESLKLEYGFRGCDVIVRGLNRGALEKASKEGNELFGLDEELKKYLGEK